MSTRWYPRFVKGNPQLRVFLPDFKMILMKPKPALPENMALFKVPVFMTKWDVKNYLEKIYKIDVAHVRTVVTCGTIRKSKLDGGLIKDEDYVRAYVSLPVGSKFEFPNLFPAEKMEEQQKDIKEMRENIEKAKVEQKRKNYGRENVPPWFAI